MPLHSLKGIHTEQGPGGYTHHRPNFLPSPMGQGYRKDIPYDLYIERLGNPTRSTCPSLGPTSALKLRLALHEGIHHGLHVHLLVSGGPFGREGEWRGGGGQRQGGHEFIPTP